MRIRMEPAFFSNPERACAGAPSGVFFSPDEQEGLFRRWNPGVAKTLCASCPVSQECGDYALDNDIRFGVWGGMSPKERETKLRERKP